MNSILFRCPLHCTPLYICTLLPSTPRSFVWLVELILFCSQVASETQEARARHLQIQAKRSQAMEARRQKFLLREQKRRELRARLFPQIAVADSANLSSSK